MPEGMDLSIQTQQVNQLTNVITGAIVSFTNAAGTNLVVSTITSTNAVKSATDKKSPPPFDPMLDETQRILLDYIALLGKGSPVAANQ
jgi:hypothetical protein